MSPTETEGLTGGLRWSALAQHLCASL